MVPVDAAPPLENPKRMTGARGSDLGGVIGLGACPYASRTTYLDRIINTSPPYSGLIGLQHSAVPRSSRCVYRVGPNIFTLLQLLATPPAATPQNAGSLAFCMNDVNCGPRCLASRAEPVVTKSCRLYLRSPVYPTFDKAVPCFTPKSPRLAI